MSVIVGTIIVLGAVLTGFSMAGGNMHALVHPSEIVTIGGAALGAMIAGSSPRVLKDMVHGVKSVFGGGGATKPAYLQLFSLLYELFQKARRDGLLVLDGILSDEAERHKLFARFPKIASNHHLETFLTGALGSLVEGSEPALIGHLLESEVKTFEHEHHEMVDALSRTADALPGFGIVAAVLGIVITMQAIDGPVEEIGHSVGAALVGTFLGILLSYGIVAPLAGRLHSMGLAEAALFRTAAAAVVGFAGGTAPKSVLDQVRRSVTTDCRPAPAEMQALYQSIDTPGAKT
jgi:chemotaxis protein MotA